MDNEEHVYIKIKDYILFFTMILVWSRRAILESSHSRRGQRELEEPVNEWLYPKFGNYSLQLPRDQQLFIFFIG